MQRKILTLAIALMGVYTQAQTTPAIQPVSDSTVYPCLLDMDANEWSAFKLTAEQLEQVKAIQTDCETDCAPRKETGEVDPRTSKAALRKHEERIRKVLTAEQYDQWRAWCRKRSDHTELVK